MPEKILAGLSEYHNLMLVINALSCISILYFLMKKHQKDNPQKDNPQNVKPQNVKPQNVKPQNVKPQNVKPQNVKPQNVNPQNVKPQNVKPQNVKHLDKPKPSSSKKIKKKPRNLSWGIANNANLQMNMREPVYQLYSVY